MSAKIKLELKPTSLDRLKIDPCTLSLSAFESQQVRVTLNTRDLAKYLEKKETAVLKDCILIKSEFFQQKVSVTINLVK